MSEGYKTNERKIKTVNIVVPIILVAAVAWATITGVQAMNLMRQLRDNHSETSAVVVYQRLYWRRQLFGTATGMYRNLIYIDYTVDGVIYQARLHGPLDWRLGDVITVYYCPDNPDIFIRTDLVAHLGGFPVFMAAGYWRIALLLALIIIPIAAVVSKSRAVEFVKNKYRWLMEEKEQ